MGHVARMHESRNMYRLLVGEPVGKRPLGSPKCKCNNNIKIDIGETKWRLLTGLVWLKIGLSGEFL